MNLPIAAVVEARDKSVKVRLNFANKPLVWLPRSAICYGEYVHAGDNIDVLDVATWAYQEIMLAIERAKTAPNGPFGSPRLIDLQAQLWRGNNVQDRD